MNLIIKEDVVIIVGGIYQIKKERVMKNQPEVKSKPSQDTGTKRPWSISTEKQAMYRRMIMQGDSCVAVTSISPDNFRGISIAEGEANARLIVKAVNCHDELVEALKAIVDDIEENHLKTYSRGDLLYKAQQALKQAEAV